MENIPTDLEGWTGIPGKELTVGSLIELAFNYRGNVTIVKTDGSSTVGYLFNREPDTATPNIQMFDEAGNGPILLPYSTIGKIIFSGKDTAKGKSYADYLNRKENIGPLSPNSLADERALQ